MGTETGRDDFIISIRSAFLNKGNRQKFSLFTLLVISIIVLSLEYFKTGPVNKFRSFSKDLIFKGSYVVVMPFVTIKENYYNFQEHLSLYEEYNKLKKKDLEIKSLKHEIDFFKSENIRLKKLIEEKTLVSENYLLTKVLLDQQSPYLKSIIINKGFKHGIKKGSSVLENSYYVGKIVDVNHLTSRVLLASDLNSKIPVIVEPGSLNAILSGSGNNDYGTLEYLPKDNEVEDGHIIYTSGIDGIISAALPVGKVIVEQDKKLVKFFVDFNQLKFVKINN